MFKSLLLVCLTLVSAAAFADNSFQEELTLRKHLVYTCGEAVPEFTTFLGNGNFDDLGKYTIRYQYIEKEQRTKACQLSTCLKAHDVWFSKYQVNPADAMDRMKALVYYDKDNVEYRRETILALDKVCGPKSED